MCIAIKIVFYSLGAAFLYSNFYIFYSLWNLFKKAHPQITFIQFLRKFILYNSLSRSPLITENEAKAAPAEYTKYLNSIKAIPFLIIYGIDRKSVV